MATIDRTYSVSASLAQTDTSSAALTRIFNGNTGGVNQIPPDAIARSTDKVLQRAAANAGLVMSFLNDRFGWNGFDGKGSPLSMVVHAPDPMTGEPMANAYWDPRARRMFVGDGDGRVMGPAGDSLDVIAHETGHAVLASAKRMGFQGEEGALHEAFGDLLGVLIDPDDWSIGEDSFTPRKPDDGGFRQLDRPKVNEHMSKIRSREPHDLADIPNLAAYRAAEAIGRENMGKIWFNGFMNIMPDNAKFSDAASATVTAAQQLFGAQSREASAVTQAWQSVGVLS
jgi:Zn-dependent metalloprotease